MGATKKIGGLTRKEKKFVKEYVKTGNATKSVLKAYDASNNNTASTIGSRLLDKDNVKQAIIERLDKKGITDDYIDSSFKHAIDKGIKENDNISDNVGMRALEYIAKLRDDVKNSKRDNEGVTVTTRYSDKSFHELLELHKQQQATNNTILQGENISDSKDK